ncbi:tetratricopeptide repeat protein [Deinococcus yavapaiensis]|uniref:Tetratricopeptide repeat protein n=1 Tax=Deinococcus yavapaiensis KR-236 TaxID=694435 RepID=A0A318SGZ5_9DEIO|nr:tetratricopeptide repeat protein [Deinococcus yavapaiensis]PYE56375.1 tetratricopeptide repeat protein [Deinococcus yavapaiensis KR-236]
MSQKLLARTDSRQLGEGPPARRLHAHVLVTSLLVAGTFIFGHAFAQTAPQTPPASASQQAAAPLTSEQQALLTRAQAALSAKDYRSARALFEQLVALRYDSSEAHFGLGLTLYALNDLPGARFEFNQLIRLDPSRFEGYFNLGVVEQRAGQYDEALKNYRSALDLARGKASNDAVVPILRAVAGEQNRRGDFVGLASTLAEQLALTPDDNDVRLALATATFRSGKGEDALPLVFEALRRTPANEAAGFLIADIFEAQGLPDRALRELNKAIVPALPDASRARLFVRRAALQLTLKQTADAVSSLQAAAQLDAKNSDAWTRLGELTFANGDIKGALAAWQGAVKADDKNVSYRLNLATVQLAAGQFSDAFVNAQLARIGAKDAALVARANFVSGVAAYRLGRFASARDDLMSAVQTKVDAESMLWLGLSEFALKNFNDAVAAFQISVNTAPNLVNRSNLGAAQLAAGQYPQAEATLRGVVTDDPKNAEAWYNLGWAIRAQGRTTDARAAFQASADLGYQKARGELR